MKNNLKILAIESSCDETAAAVIGDDNGKPVVLSNVVSSQVDLHALTGGVVPEVASRAHMEAIIPVVTEALIKAKENGCHCEEADRPADEAISEIAALQNHIARNDSYHSDLLNEITHIAVTAGPGLIGSLLVGFNAAKTLAYALDKPIIPINHIEGHVFSALCAEKKSKVKSLKSKENSDQNFQLSTFNFPLLALVVSGGHTSLILMKDYGQYEMIGQTLDDAAGEAFDKVARLLDLGYPGGPAISKLAHRFRINQKRITNKRKNEETNSPNSLTANNSSLSPLGHSSSISDLFFPRPLINDGTFNFSFSGLKTAVLYEVKRRIGDSGRFGDCPPRGLSPDEKAEIATAFEDAAVDVLVTKTMRAIEQYQPNTVVLAGGVAANNHLREQLKLKIENSKLKINLMIPPLDLCGDNAAMIGLAAYYRLVGDSPRGGQSPFRWDKIKIDSNWEL